MSINDFDSIPEDKDEVIISKMGAAVRQAMKAREELSNSLNEALDASSTFGYELGAEDMLAKIVDAFESDDSACVGWALGVIERATSAKE